MAGQRCFQEPFEWNRMELQCLRMFVTVPAEESSLFRGLNIGRFPFFFPIISTSHSDEAPFPIDQGSLQWQLNLMSLVVNCSAPLKFQS